MERRSKIRYPLALKVRYRAQRQTLYSGEGLALNLSSGGALVGSQHKLEVGTELEMSMEWPSLLDGWISLQLVATARVVRCGTTSFAVCFRRHQFRTLRSKLQPIAGSDHDPKIVPGRQEAKVPVYRMFPGIA